MRTRFFSLLGACIQMVLCAVVFLPQSALAFNPVDLKCESLKNPLGIDVIQPRLSWKMESRQDTRSRGTLQTAYQILVASSPEQLARDAGDLWDSGKVTTRQSVHVEYGGKALSTREQCHWKVRIWDDKGSVSQWSKPVHWTMGLLKPEDWRARWIMSDGSDSRSLKDRAWLWSSKAAQGDPAIRPPGRAWFRNHLFIPATADISSATLLLSADNSFVAFVNGRQVLEGSNWQTLSEAEVGLNLAHGHNVIAVVATNGGTSPNPAGLIGMLIVNFKNGACVTIPVDTRWKTCSQEFPDWAEVSFDDKSWTPAVEVAKYGDGEWGEQVAISKALPLFRKTFKIDKRVRRAQLALCGLGFNEPRLNGKSLDDAVLEPGWTDYRKTCLYTVYDLTERLVHGENTLGVMLGNGMYHVAGGRYTKFTGSFGPPKLIAQLDIEYVDGSTAQILSDQSWKTAPGPIVFSCIYGGEDYDARKELPGWDKSEFNATAWQAAHECDGPGGHLTTRSGPPIRVKEMFRPVKLSQPRPGTWVYDLGQNFSGWPCLTVRGAAGATVRMITGELVDRNGFVSQRSSGTPVWFAYTLKGKRVESWHPQFSYTGFRYVQVEGAVPEDEPKNASEKPRLLHLEGQFLYPDTEATGSFSCSNPDVNRVHGLILAAIKSNFKSVLTDCPHREKLGWLECAHLLAGCFMYNFDCARFYEKISNDMREAQIENGMVPDIAPEYTVFGGGFRDSPEWGSASVIAPWLSYEMYGDSRILRDQYETMKRYTGYLRSQSKKHIVSHGLGDWYDIGPNGPGESQLTSRGLTATGVYFQDLDILRKTAALLGRDNEAREFEKLGEEVGSSFNAAFFHAGKNQYDRNSQTGNAMPLFLGLTPPEHRLNVLENLANNISQNTNRVTAGDVGFYYVVQALQNGGRSDVLYNMLCQTNGPGYLYQLRMNATSLTEAWDTDAGSSQNHCMLGHIEEWFYTGLLGIRPETPGFQKIIISPYPAEGMAWAGGSYDSVYGRIASRWKHEAGRFTLDVTIPPNTTALVTVPTRDFQGITESGKIIAKARGVKLLRTENNATVFAVGSGTYQFQSPF